MNYSLPEKEIDYQQVHKDITKFLKEFDEFEETSRKSKLRIGGDNCSYCQRYLSK